MNNNLVGKNVIGCDETGVGDYMTPLVASAVFVPKQNVEKLKSLGVTDSKLLSDSQITVIFNNIKAHIKSSVRFFGQKQYNFINKNYNANELKWILHTQAINSLEERIDLKDIDIVVIDKFTTEKSIAKYDLRILQDEGLRVTPIKSKTLFVEKGEHYHVSVAAASIVARAYFIELMSAQNEKWGMKFLLGTNPRVEAVARNFIQKHGEDKLYEVAKISFRTTKNVLK